MPGTWALMECFKTPGVHSSPVKSEDNDEIIVYSCSTTELLCP